VVAFLAGVTRGLHLDGLADHPHSAKDDPLQRAQRSDERKMWARLLAGLPHRYRRQSACVGQ